MTDRQTSPCPFCGGNATPMHTDDCYFTINKKLKDAPKGDLSLVPDLLAAWNRRAAPAVDAQAGGKTDADGLPSLPAPIDSLAAADGFGVIGTQDVYIAEQVRQAQREAIAVERERNMARIKHLTHERDQARADLRAQLAQKDNP